MKVRVATEYRCGESLQILHSLGLQLSEVGQLPHLAMSSATGLCSASSSRQSIEPLENSVLFKSGALYAGSVKKGSRTRCGQGTFSWPSGLQYTGEFWNNKRQGAGLQVWPDGSKYEGRFEDDMRHGHGRHSWKNGEVCKTPINYKLVLFKLLSFFFCSSCRCTKVTMCVTRSTAMGGTAGLQGLTSVATSRVTSERALVSMCLLKERNLK